MLQVTLEALAPGGNFVPAMWQHADAATYAYKSWQECPTTGAKVTSSADTPAAVITAIGTAFAQFPYGASKAIGTPVLTFPAAGAALITVGGSTFRYGISQVRAVVAAVARISVPCPCAGAPLGALALPHSPRPLSPMRIDRP